MVKSSRRKVSKQFRIGYHFVFHSLGMFQEPPCFCISVGGFGKVAWTEIVSWKLKKWRTPVDDKQVRASWTNVEKQKYHQLKNNHMSLSSSSSYFILICHYYHHCHRHHHMPPSLLSSSSSPSSSSSAASSLSPSAKYVMSTSVVSKIGDHGLPT